MSLFQKIKDHFNKKNQNAYFEGFKKTDEKFGEGLRKLLNLNKGLDDAFYKDLMQVLIESDVGLETSQNLLNRLKKEVKQKSITTSADAIDQLGSDILEVLNDYRIVLEDKLNIILMVGVNGSGKTTSSAKLAQFYKLQGKKVMLVAADTFRAAAVKQLQTWAQRIDVPCFAGKENQDPASVVVDACRKAVDDNIDVLIIDTAGRLQNKVNLMQELQKIHRVIEKTVGYSAQHSFLVLDASTGQNALSQASSFLESSNINAIICTKMDGTAKGGVIIALALTLKIPVSFVGLGEGINDLKEFDKEAYLASITQGLQ
ncbi:MAG TPA: signal recognition particle-docking protein FtsY [Erysipelotrichaceae bacterium]|nr:signal recognition particle-docking protein FtsY [Erysipelotrichaceae bacterium]